MRFPGVGRGLGVVLALVSFVLSLSVSLSRATAQTPAASPPRSPDETIACEILVVGGGLSGTAATYEALLDGRTVCLTDITDWVGGQITSQGTSALDEVGKQRAELFYSHGYKVLRQSIEKKYGMLNPGDCWVSASCFIPRDAQDILWKQLQAAAKQGKGKLHWLPTTVIKALEFSPDRKLIRGAIAIQHQPDANAPPLNTLPLSQTIADAYRYENSAQFSKKIIHLVPQTRQSQAAAPSPTPWIVIDATETGELIALADVPYRLGIDPRSYLNPSSPLDHPDPYCTQGFTYTFALEQTADPQPQPMPSFYPEYAPYYSYERRRDNTNYFDLVFTYRRIWSPEPRSAAKAFNVSPPKPGDISMQNWTWGNDYRPGTAQDNLIYSRDQLQQQGQLAPGDWQGGLRTETLHKAEENALGFYYWLVEGTTDSQLGAGVKQPAPNHRFVSGLNAPMGTAHGLSKYPYIREGRRIVGRPAYGYADGFSISEIDISRVDYRDPYYKQTLPPTMYRQLWIALAGLEAASAIRENTPPDRITRRTRSTIYPDAVGISFYAIDFHPCMTLSPPETPGNTERAGVRQAHGPSYPAQIPLRALIPQQIDNLLVTGKGIAASFIAAAAYRVHSYEWSSGAAAGTTASFALAKGILPYELVDDLPQPEPLLQQLQQRLTARDNPIAFPDTSIFNLNWDDWKVW